MRFSRKVVSILLTLAIALPLLTVPTFAAESLTEATEAADILHEAGLFGGTGTDASGKPIYSLESVATRAQAVVMLVRVLGKTEEAKTAPAAPFSDIPEWTAPSINYAYAQGLTQGIGGGKFGPNRNVTINQYLTFLIRALGYGNHENFSYNKAAEFFGWLDSFVSDDYFGYYEMDGTQNCTRADMVIATLKAMFMQKEHSVDRLEDTLGLNLRVPQWLSTSLWMEKNEQLPHINTGNPLIDKRVHVLDLDSPSPHIRPNQYGRYNIVIDGFPPVGLPYATLLTGGTTLIGTELVADPNLSLDDNITRLRSLIHRLDENMDLEGRYWPMGTERNLAIDFGNIWCSGDARVHHTLFLNCMAYFDRDMAVRLYGMLYEYNYESTARMVDTEPTEANHYLRTKITNSEGPMTSELARRYGLTLLNQVDTSYDKTLYNEYEATITNGNSTWVLNYIAPSNGGVYYIMITLVPY